MGLPAERNEPYDYDKVNTAYKYAVELASASERLADFALVEMIPQASLANEMPTG